MNQKSVEEENRQLKEELKTIKRLNQELLNSQREQDSLDFSWAGNLGHWYWDFEANKVTFNPLKAEALGFKKEELPEYVNFQFFTDRLHPEDFEHVMNEMREHLKGNIPVWEVRYRIKAKSNTYKTYYDRGKVTQRKEDGSPLFLVGIVFDITEYEDEKRKLLEKNKEWERRVKIDSLTGLLNRSNILFKLGQLITESKKTNKSLSMILFDIDNLGHQNLLFGPLFGDEVIRKASAVVKKHLSADDVAGSFEGGKFLIVLKDSNKEEAHQLAEIMRNELHTTEFSQPADITSSSGVAQYLPDETVSQFFNRADNRLDNAKIEGKNNVSS